MNDKLLLWIVSLMGTIVLGWGAIVWGRADDNGQRIAQVDGRQKAIEATLEELKNFNRILLEDRLGRPIPTPQPTPPRR